MYSTKCSNASGATMPNNYFYNVAQLFERIATDHGDRPALKYVDGSVVTYRALDELSTRIAAYLYIRGLRRRDILAIVHSKTPRCYAAMIAALKLGAVYVNIDDRSPAARLLHVFASAMPKMIVGESFAADVASAARDRAVEMVAMDDTDFERSLERTALDVPFDIDLILGSDPAYIMYTSGSTGVPKGALISHAGVVNFARWVEKRFDIVPEDTFTNVNPMYFDNSVFDFYGAILNGAAIAPVPRDALSDAAEVLRYAEKSDCTIWFSVPSLLVFLSTMKVLSPDRLRTVRSFVFGGEGYPKAELRKLYAHFGDRSNLINVYGPTECTCICSAKTILRTDLDGDTGLVSLGSVSDNFSMVIVRDGREAVPGEIGELCLTGPQVGLGYVSDSDRSSIAFVNNPFNHRWRERMYKTGDLVRLSEDGRSLDFIGRVDNQVKHMGYRIELEEIEFAINKYEKVMQALVVQRVDRRGMKMLVAYIAGVEGLRDDDIRNHLQSLLPQYMIPQRFVFRESLPKNANGKVDRNAVVTEPFEL